MILFNYVIVFQFILGSNGSADLYDNWQKLVRFWTKAFYIAIDMKKSVFHINNKHGFVWSSAGDRKITSILSFKNSVCERDIKHSSQFCHRYGISWKVRSAEFVHPVFFVGKKSCL